jgi:hypothetical protein
MMDVANCFQDRTTWRYKGLAQFFGCPARLEGSEVDFTNVISFSLEDLGPQFDINRFVCELVEMEEAQAEASDNGPNGPSTNQELSQVTLKRIRAVLRAVAPKQLKELAEDHVKIEHLARKDRRKPPSRKQ